MKSILFLSFCLITFGAYAQETTINDPNAEVRSATAFHAVEVSGGIDLYISAGEPAVAVSARDAQVRDVIKTEVRNGVLYISFDYKYMKLLKGGNNRLRAYVAGKGLNRLVASGGSDIHISGRLQADTLSVAISGGSDVDGQIEAGRFSIAQTGGSDAHLKGRVGDLRIEASGGSDFKGYDLSSDNCSISATGGSDINITVNRELSAEASGASDISWKGAATVRKARASGAGSVSHRS